MNIGTRRAALLGALMPLLSLCAAQAQEFDPTPLETEIEDIERRLDARVGVTVIDKETGLSWNHRGKERFPTNSTFKAFLCGAVLDASDKGKVNLQRKVTIQEGDIVNYSPVTEKHVNGKGFTIEELCEITVTISDNAAANLVMETLEGPEGLNTFLRSIGDMKTRADRWEPYSNTGIPGDERDTTTPNAAAETLQKLVLEDTLAPESRKKLTNWLIGNKVGNSTLRAGLPEGWRIADKTGAGQNGSRNNIAVIWPEGRKPVVIAVYITQTTASYDNRNKAIAGIASALSRSLLP
ncbi:MAG: class A beta-lactamase [Roseibium sp.]|uniref:class A beta-lactamase n=1 Tax=Roseibium sp. TaxID=1936156 RepID=UPI002627C888|nr:class A beta-lactamase [Roseibium sp.]MCV0424742.1 class A beta-lactamase [Roseibium sp.]